MQPPANPARSSTWRSSLTTWGSAQPQGSGSPVVGVGSVPVFVLVPASVEAGLVASVANSSGPQPARRTTRTSLGDDKAPSCPTPAVARVRSSGRYPGWADSHARRTPIPVRVDADRGADLCSPASPRGGGLVLPHERGGHRIGAVEVVVDDEEPAALASDPLLRRLMCRADLIFTTIISVRRVRDEQTCRSRAEQNGRCRTQGRQTSAPTLNVREIKIRTVGRAHPLWLGVERREPARKAMSRGLDSRGAITPHSSTFYQTPQKSLQRPAGWGSMD